MVRKDYEVKNKQIREKTSQKTTQFQRLTASSNNNKQTESHVPVLLLVINAISFQSFKLECFLVVSIAAGTAAAGAIGDLIQKIQTVHISLNEICMVRCGRIPGNEYY